MLRSSSLDRHLHIVKPTLAACILATFLWALLSQGRIADATPRAEGATSGRLAAAPARLAPPAVGRFQVDDSPVITVTKEDQFPGASAEPGETITYTIVVTNESITDALGVTLSDTIDLHSNLVDGSLRASPMAAADAYDATGNTRITITPTNGLLANDVDADDPAPNPAFNDGLTIVLSDTTSANGGDVGVNADGSFTYDPPPGFEGIDTFTYTIEDGHGLADVGIVTVAVSDVIWYVDHTATAGGDGRSHSPFDTLAAFNSTAADDPGDVIFLYEQGGGPYDNGITLLDGQRLVGQGVDLTATVGLTPTLGSTFPGVTSNPTLDNNTADNGSNGVVLAQNNALHGLDVGVTGGTGITGTNFGTLTVSTASVVGSGAILNLDSGTLDAAFATLSTSSSTTTGVSLTSVDGDLTASGGSIAGTAGTAFDVDGGFVSVTFPGTISQSAAARLVQVQNRPIAAGALRFSGNVICNTSCTGINVANNSGGTVNFSSGSKILNTGANPGVAFSNNTGSAILFTNGGLDIDTTSGAGIDATGGGAVSVIGSGNHIDTTTGIGVSVVNTTIGVGGMTFESISVNGATNGILLDNTGTSGFFTVTGDGSTAGSGGTITGTTDDGIALSNASDIDIAWMSVSNAGVHEIHINVVTDFRLTDSVVSDSTNVAGPAGDDEHGIFIENLHGVNNLVQDVSFPAINENAIDINNSVNDDATQDLLTINTTTCMGHTSEHGEHCIAIVNSGTSNQKVDIQAMNATINANGALYVLSTAIDSAHLEVEVNGGDFFTNAPFPTTAVQLQAAGTSSTYYTVTNNVFNEPNFEAIIILNDDDATTSANISGNEINGTASGTPRMDYGIRLRQDENGELTALIDNNDIDNYDVSGILVIARDTTDLSGRADVTLTRNTLATARGTQFGAGLEVRSSGNNALCADIGGNGAENDAVGAGSNSFPSLFDHDIAIREQDSSVLTLPSLTGTVESFIQGRNTGVPTVGVEGSPTAGAPCAMVPTSSGVVSSPDRGANLAEPASSGFGLPEINSDIVATSFDSFLRSPSNASHSEVTGHSLLATLNGISWLRETLPHGRHATVNVRPAVLVKPLAAPSALAPLATPGDTQTLLADPFTLPGGETFTVTFAVTTATTLPAGVDSVQNQAAVMGSNFDDVLSVDPNPHPDFPPANGETITPLSILADLVVAKADAPDPVAAGETLTYTVTITNNGPSDAQDVVATDTLTDVLTLQSTVGCAEDPNGAPTCSLGAIAAGSTARYTITALIDSAILADTITNAVTVASSTSEAAPGDESATITTTVNAVADLELRKVDNPDPVLAGRPLTYTLILTNHGPSLAQGVFVTDTLPVAGYTYAGNNCGATFSTPMLDWTIGDVPAGDAVTCVISGTVNAGVGGTITNTAGAGLAATVADPDLGNNTVDEPTTVVDTLFTVDDVTLAEGDAGATTFTFTISRSNNVNAPSVDVTTAAGTATAGTDYTVLPTTTVSFAAGGDLTQTVTVDVSGDALVELDETFFLSLSNPIGAGIGDGQGVGTILNDDAAELNVTDVDATEGDSGVTTVVFSVTLSAAVDAPVNVDYATADASATAADGDYAPITGTLAFTGTAGETMTFTVDALGDAVVEPDEHFHVDLSNVAAAGRDVTLAPGRGMGTIVNDDTATLSIGDVSANEGNAGSTTYVFSVTLSAAVDVPIDVDYATADAGATVADGDYTPASGTLNFAGTAGETMAIAVDVHGDTVAEPDESFYVDLSDLAASGRDVTLVDDRGEGAILNDDGAVIYLPLVHVAVATANPYQPGGGDGVQNVTRDPAAIGVRRR